MEPGWVVAIVALGAVLVGAVGIAGMGRGLQRWREEVDVPSTPEDETTVREEVRQMVVAANARRERRGEEPLDVEAEVERRLRGEDGHGDADADRRRQ